MNSSVLSLDFDGFARTDLCDAYVLCLIDEVDGVLDADCVEAAPLPVSAAMDPEPSPDCAELLPEESADEGALCTLGPQQPAFAPQQNLYQEG